MSRWVADKRMNIHVFVCIQEGRGMDLARAASEARQGKPRRAPWAGRHMAWLIVTGCDELLAGGCRNLVFWAMQRPLQQL